MFVTKNLLKMVHFGLFLLESMLVVLQDCLKFTTIAHVLVFQTTTESSFTCFECFLVYTQKPPAENSLPFSAIMINPIHNIGAEINMRNHTLTLYRNLRLLKLII